MPTTFIKISGQVIQKLVFFSMEVTDWP
jgi:hypothetical protein